MENFQTEALFCEHPMYVTRVLYTARVWLDHGLRTRDRFEGLIDVFQHLHTYYIRTLLIYHVYYNVLLISAVQLLLFHTSLPENPRVIEFRVKWPNRAVWANLCIV